MSDVWPGIAGRTAVVTGASRGIGAGIALALAMAGARVVVTGRDPTALSNALEAITGRGGQAIMLRADLTQEEDVQALREAAETAFGPVSLLVACAGGGGDPRPLREESAARWRATVDANLTSAFLTLAAFLPPMIEMGRGAVVTMASAAGRQPSGSSMAYAAAKAGLLSLTRQVAIEAAPHGVRINAVAPSAIVTDRLAAAPQHVRDKIAEGFPLHRLGQVEDVADAVLFLLSERSSWLTGITLDVAGGRVML